MNKITEITRRDIIELFRDGYIESTWLGTENIFYPYSGRLNEVEFLEKLYSLDKMPSYDTKLKNAKEDIWQHTVRNNDWESGWIFEDNRFELLKGSDLTFLNFICAVFHPENRSEKGYWKEYLGKINNLIKIDGYELYVSDKISGRDVYSWRKITREESVSKRFIPFSIRNKKELEAKTIILHIPKKVRKDLLDIFIQYDEILHMADGTNWYSISTIEALLQEDIRKYYIPKAFDDTGKYSETNNFNSFIMNNYPYCVFDAIELFAIIEDRYNNFADEVNLVFQNNDFAYKLLGGRIEVPKMTIQTNEIIREVGLKELMEQAMLLYRNNNISDKQLAVEKLWDAFERLKTYYSDLDKKKSAEKIIDEISNKNDAYKNLFKEEFKKLTDIGNQFRIRHHEIDRIDITDSNYYNYLFQRCFALIELALKYLN